MAAANELKKKLDDWKGRLDGPDQHSIGRQVAAMLWQSAFYRSINESRKLLPENEDGTKMGNAALHELIDSGYFITHAAAIRRLLDKGATLGSKGVYSLYGLIRDLKDNCHLLTRENVIAARDLPYDFEPIKNRAREDAIQTARAQGHGGYFVSRRLHPKAAKLWIRHISPSASERSERQNERLLRPQVSTRNIS